MTDKQLGELASYADYIASKPVSGTAALLKSPAVDHHVKKAFAAAIFAKKNGKGTLKRSRIANSPSGAADLAKALVESKDPDVKQAGHVLHWALRNQKR